MVINEIERGNRPTRLGGSNVRAERWIGHWAYHERLSSYRDGRHSIHTWGAAFRGFERANFSMAGT
jgi:hypothetical protein